MTRSRVVVSHPLPGGLGPLEGFDVVVAAPPRSPDQLLPLVADADALVCLLTVPVDAELLAHAPRLKVVANVAVGYDNVDVAAATRAGVVVCNTPGVLDEATADLAFALILSAARRLSEAERDLRAGRWQGWSMDQYLGVEVYGATLGLIGYGRIGRAVARRAAGFSMQVLHHARQPTGVPGYVTDRDELLSRADVVSLHVPATRETFHLVGRRELKLMKPTAVLVNTSRGTVVDEEALADALQAGSIFAAGLDVYEDEPRIHPRLLAAPRTVLLPHIGSASAPTRRRMAEVAMRAARVVLQGRLPAVAVNPEAWSGRRPRPVGG